MQDDLSPEEEALEYRSLSPLAVGGLVLGVLSCFALISPALVLLPVVAAIVSIIGLIAVASAPETRTGHSLAMTGLALSVAIGVATLVRTSVAKRLEAESSAVVADRFLEAIADGDYVAAHELTLSLRYRRPSDELARLYYEADENAAEQLKTFGEEPAVVAIAKGGHQRIAGSFERTFNRGTVIGYWFAEPAEGTGEIPGVVLELARTPPRLAGPASWWVTKYRIQR